MSGVNVGSVALSDIIDRRKVVVSDTMDVKSCFLVSLLRYGMEPVMSEMESGSV